MPQALLGIHHITAIVDDPQENVDFYAQVLGLRLVKQTVNFDDPYTYHLYYGDDLGRPGTLVTFFPWPGGQRGSRGTGQITAMAFAVPAGALSFWSQRLAEQGVRTSEPGARFGQPVLSFYDPSGLLLELVERPEVAALPGWSNGPVPIEPAIRSLAGVTLTVARHAPTGALLRDTLGFKPVASEGSAARYLVGEGSDAAAVDVIERPDVPYGLIAAGTVHHVAWRVAGDADQQQWREHLLEQGIEVTPVRDRNYFHSIYFREPGGVLYEIATDTPGFATDEAPEALGTRLQLPPWLEPMRNNIERHLPPLRLPDASAQAAREA